MSEGSEPGSEGRDSIQETPGPPTSEPAYWPDLLDGDLRARRYQAMIEHSADMVLIVDRAARPIAASPSVERFFGLMVDYLAAPDPLSFIHADDRDTVRAVLGKVLNGESGADPLELRIVSPNGTQWVVEATATDHTGDPAVGGIVVNLHDVTRRKAAEAELRRAHERYRTLTDSLVYGVMLFDADGRLLLCNDTLSAIFGFDASSLLGEHVSDIVAMASDSGTEIQVESKVNVVRDEHPIMTTLRTGVPVEGLLQRVTTTAGQVVWLRSNARPVYDEPGGELNGVAVSFADVTSTVEASAELEHTLAELDREHTFLQVVLDNVHEGIVACDADGRLTLMNHAGRLIHGLDGARDPVGELPRVTGLRHPNGIPITPEENPLYQALAGTEVRDAELVVENRLGETRVVAVNAQALYDTDGSKLGAVAAMVDITDRKHTEEHLTILALHDPLTGLANRILLDDRLNLAIDGLRRSGGRKGAGLFLIDLDGFKEINDAYGHDVGDEVLIMVARRLQTTVRPHDTVARFGGDEFVIVCEVSGGEEEVTGIGRRIESVLTRPYTIEEDLVVKIGASVGGVLIDDIDAEPGELLNWADEAMYLVKARRRARRARGGRDTPMEIEPS